MLFWFPIIQYILLIHLLNHHLTLYPEKTCWLPEILRWKAHGWRPCQTSPTSQRGLRTGVRGFPQAAAGHQRSAGAELPAELHGAAVWRVQPGWWGDRVCWEFAAGNRSHDKKCRFQQCGHNKPVAGHQGESYTVADGSRWEKFVWLQFWCNSTAFFLFYGQA